MSSVAPNSAIREMKRGLARVTLAGRGIRYRNFFQEDNVAIFPELGVIFNRIKKSGNTSVCAFLNDVAGGPGFRTADEMKDARRFDSARLADIARLGTYKSLIVVRDPYTRILSGFLQKIVLANDERFRRFPGFGEQTDTAFVAFLRYLEENDYGGNRHFWPQVRLLYQPPDAYTFTAKLETLTGDMADFLSAIGRDPAMAKALEKPHPLEARQAGKITSAGKNRHLITDEARELVRRLYREDFETFEYTP